MDERCDDTAAALNAVEQIRDGGCDMDRALHRWVLELHLETPPLPEITAKDPVVSSWAASRFLCDQKEDTTLRSWLLHNASARRREDSLESD